MSYVEQNRVEQNITEYWNRIVQWSRIELSRLITKQKQLEQNSAVIEQRRKVQQNRLTQSEQQS